MAKKAAARKSRATKRAKSSSRKAAGARAARRNGVDFKRLHAEMDAAIDKLRRFKPSVKRDLLMFELKLISKFKPCPRTGMFAELE